MPTLRLLSAPCLLLSAGLASAALPVPGTDYRPGELLVRYHTHAGSAAALAKSRLGLSSRRHLDPRTELLALPAITSVPQALTLLRADPAVEIAEPNYRRYRHAVRPNDPLFDQQWGLLNSGQANFIAGGPAGVPGADMNLAEAWDADGDGLADRVGDGSAIVALIDDGFDLDHPDLAANFIPGFDFADNDSNPDAGSQNFHGTLVAGCVGGVGGNGQGLAGVAWNVKLLPLRFDFDTASAIAAYDYARRQGAKIINASYGGPSFSQLERDAIAALADDDILFVTSAGNNDSNLDVSRRSYPANYGLPNILSVAATNRQDGIAGYSQFGPTTVDLAAPGLQILSTALGGGYTPRPGVTGTSFAAPYTAGAAALLRMEFPAAGFREIKARLMEGAQAGAGANRQVRSGRLDVDRALELSARPSLLIASARLIDGGNGVLDPGESAELEISLRNQWQAATAVQGRLVVEAGGASAPAATLDFGNIAADGSASRRFPIQLPADASGYRQLRLRLDVSAAGGYRAERGLLIDSGLLRDGQAQSQSIQTSLYDEFHTWHFEAPAGLRRLSFESRADQDIDLLVRHGAPAEYLITLDVDPDTGEQIFSTNADRVGGDASGNELVSIDNPAAGTWFVTVVNYAQVDNTRYSLLAESNRPDPPAGASGGGGLWLAPGLWLALVWRRRRRTRP